jgi:hypothetical protein
VKLLNSFYLGEKLMKKVKVIFTVGNLTSLFLLMIIVCGYSTTTIVMNSDFGSSVSNLDILNNQKMILDNHDISEASDQFSNYTLDLYLDTEHHYLSGNMIFDYINTENIPIDILYFHLYPNASEYEEIPGYMLINTIKTADKQQSITYDFGYQLLNVTLPKSVQPDETFSLWIEFETAITDNQSYRLTYADDPIKGHVIALCNFYPILAVYDEKDEWNLEPLYDVGDPFYSDLANYYVNLTIHNEYKVASSGQLVSQTAKNSLIEYEYQLLKARDFAFAISPDYTVKTGTYGNTKIYVYYVSYDFLNWTNSVEQTKYSLELFTELFGPYPYPTISVAATHGDYSGMEWPGLVYIKIGNSYVETGIAHEVAHQWFYAVVGIDQIDEGFLDEGIVCYCHWYYFEERYNYYQAFSRDHLWRTAEKNNRTRFPEGLVINRSINDIISAGLDPYYYWEVAYHKAPSVYHLLRTYIGDENFFNSLQRFYTLFSFQTATFNDLIDCFNYYTDIEWFLPWFNEGFLPEINIKSVEREVANDDYELFLTIQQTGSSSYKTKIPFLISFSSGSDSLIWVWCNNSDPVTIQQIFDKKPVTIEADPTSGYLYTLDFLTMEPISIQDLSSTDQSTTTRASDGFLFPLVLSVLLLSVIIGKKRLSRRV